MKKKVYNSIVKVLVFACFITCSFTAFSQLKIGTNPTQINKSSILELESDKQGFLLPRLTDTTGINALTPPEGMLIYFNPNNATGKGLYIRKSGMWQRFTTDSISLDKWSKMGDVLAGNEKFGSLNAQTLRIITNGVERMNIDGTTGNVNVSNSAAINKSLVVTDTTTSRKLIVNDSVQLKSLNTSNSLTEILVIDTANGAVRRRTISTDAFKNWVVGSFRNTTNANGLSRIAGSNGMDTLVLHAASAITPGGVSVTTQTFGGSKTFQDSLMAAKTLMVGGTSTANSTLQVEGSVAMSIKTVTANTTLSSADYTVLVNASGGAVTVTLPAPSSSISGRVYIIKKIGGGLTNDVTLSGAIEDGTSFSIYNDWTVVKVQTDGSKWYVIK
jgi:hypothetical protein